ncbi:MAG: hypothetical protein AAF620_06610 [Bacteroidota bacterium]
MAKQMDSITLEMINNMQAINQLIIPWASPVPVFGDISKARIATLGINPSDKEYIDNDGKMLSKEQSRFQNLFTLGIKDWSNITQHHLELIIKSCDNYFNNNPYSWFSKLDYLVSGTMNSYYFPYKSACHLDLVPYATKKKWSQLNLTERQELISKSSNYLGKIIKNSKIDLVVLNGAYVVSIFENIINEGLEKVEKTDWSLPRRNSIDVKGYAYYKTVTKISNVDLGKTVLILGYNHNIQSSFGVTRRVMTSIREWISNQYGMFLANDTN